MNDRFNILLNLKYYKTSKTEKKKKFTKNDFLVLKKYLYIATELSKGEVCFRLHNLHSSKNITG